MHGFPQLAQPSVLYFGIYHRTTQQGPKEANLHRDRASSLAASAATAL